MQVELVTHTQEEGVGFSGEGKGTMPQPGMKNLQGAKSRRD